MQASHVSCSNGWRDYEDEGHTASPADSTRYPSSVSGITGPSNCAMVNIPHTRDVNGKCDTAYIEVITCVVYENSVCRSAMGGNSVDSSTTKFHGRHWTQSADVCALLRHRDVLQ